MERAKDLLVVLELVDWKWDINQVLAQPEQELDAVMYLKYNGEKIRKQARDSEGSSVETI